MTAPCAKNRVLDVITRFLINPASLDYSTSNIDVVKVLITATHATVTWPTTTEGTADR